MRSFVCLALGLCSLSAIATPASDVQVDNTKDPIQRLEAACTLSGAARTDALTALPVALEYFVVVDTQWLNRVHLELAAGIVEDPSTVSRIDDAEVRLNAQALAGRMRLGSLSLDDRGCASHPPVDWSAIAAR